MLPEREPPAHTQTSSVLRSGTYLAMSRSSVPRGISMGFHQAGIGITATCLQKHRRAGMWEGVSTRVGSAFLGTHVVASGPTPLSWRTLTIRMAWEGVRASAEHLRTNGLSRSRFFSLELCSRGSHLTLLADIDDTHAGIST